jgi:hypothetical protein
VGICHSSVCSRATVLCMGVGVNVYVCVGVGVGVGVGVCVGVCVCVSLSVGCRYMLYLRAGNDTRVILELSCVGSCVGLRVLGSSGFFGCLFGLNGFGGMFWMSPPPFLANLLA